MDDTKKCPICHEEIKAEAKLCRYCRTEFDLTRKGYCSICHEVFPAGEDEKCSRCGGQLINITLESTAKERPERPLPLTASANTLPASETTSASGRVREGYIPCKRQLVGGSLLIFAAVLLFFCVYGAGIFPFVKWLSPNLIRWGYHPFGFTFLRWGHGPLGTIFAPIAIYGLALVIPLAIPGRIIPYPAHMYKTARKKANRSFKSTIKNSGIKKVYRKSTMKPKIIVSSLLYLVVLITTVSNIYRITGMAGATLGAGVYITIAASVIGLLGGSLMWPTSRNEVLKTDELGHVFRGPDQEDALIT